MDFRVNLLSGFRLRVENGPDVTPRWNKARALIAMLALEPSGRLERRVAAERLWSPPSDPLVNLRQLLSATKGHFSESGFEILSAHRSHIAIDPDALTSDLVILERLAASDCPAAVNEGLASIAFHEVLGGVSGTEPALEEWLEDQRAELHRRALLAANSIMCSAFQSGDLAGAGAAASLMLQIEPAAEEAYRVLMRIASARGDRGEAIAHFEACQREMRRLVDVEASPETVTLMEEIRDGRLPAEPGPLQPGIELKPALTRVAAPLQPERVHSRGDRLALLSVRFSAQEKSSAVENGVSEVMQDAITETLSSIGWLFRVVDDTDDDVDVDYHLRGFSRCDDCALRVSLRLVDAATSTLLWADHFDLPHGHSFERADFVGGIVATTIERELLVNEATDVWRKMPEQMGWRNRMMQAVPLIFRLTPASLQEAETLLASVAESAPGNATPIAWLAFVGFLKLGQGAAGDPVPAREELSWLVRRGIELQPDNVLMNAVAGHVASFSEHRYDIGLDYFDRANRINRHSAYPWAFSALTQSYIGNIREAMGRLKTYKKLWPNDPYPHFFNTARCIVGAMAGEHRATVDLAKRTLGENPNFHATYRPLISSLGHLGRVDEAQRYLSDLRKREPDFSLDWFQANYPPLSSEAHVHYVDGFIKAGVPVN